MNYDDGDKFAGTLIFGTSRHRTSSRGDDASFAHRPPKSEGFDVLIGADEIGGLLCAYNYVPLTFG